MGDIPASLNRLTAVLDIAQEAVNLVNDVIALSETLDGKTDALIANLGTLSGKSDNILQAIADLQSLLIVRLNHVDDVTEATEFKASTSQFMLSRATGFPNDIFSRPTLDLRFNLGGVTRFAPGEGHLYQWFEFLTHGLVPNVVTNLASLGAVSAPSTLAVPDCWGLQVEATDIPVGVRGSGQPDAPAYEWLARLAFGRDGFYQRFELMAHPKSLFIPRDFIPDSVAIEPRPGVILDVAAILPVGYS